MPLYKDREKRVFDGEEWERDVLAVDCCLCGKRIVDAPITKKLSYEHIETLCKVVFEEKHYKEEYLCFDCSGEVEEWYNEYISCFDNKMSKWASSLNEVVASLRKNPYAFLEGLIFCGKWNCLKIYKEELNTEEKYKKIFLFLKKYLTENKESIFSSWINTAYDTIYEAYITKPAIREATWKEDPPPFSFEDPTVRVCDKTFRAEKRKLGKKYLKNSKKQTVLKGM